jgi:hypothetical protein
MICGVLFMKDLSECTAEYESKRITLLFLFYYDDESAE